MISATERYQRVRGQVQFLLSVVELLARSIDPDSGPARTARRAVTLARDLIATTESAAEVYATIVAELDVILRQVEQLKREGRSPSNLEWESLRGDLERASARIAASVDGAGDGSFD